MDFSELLSAFPPSLRWLVAVGSGAAAFFTWRLTRSGSVREETDVERQLRETMEENARLHAQAELTKIERQFEARLGDCRQMIRTECHNLEQSLGSALRDITHLKADVEALKSRRR